MGEAGRHAGGSPRVDLTELTAPLDQLEEDDHWEREDLCWQRRTERPCPRRHPPRRLSGPPVSTTSN